MKAGVIVVALAILISLAAAEGEDDNSAQTLHKKMIARRREEHFILMKNIAKNLKYELRFNLIVAGLDKVFEIIKKNRDIMDKENTDKITEAKMTTIENTCLLMDFIVNFSDDNLIYKALKKLNREHWLGDLILSLNFLEKHVDLLDELTTKEFKFVQGIMRHIIHEQPLPKYPFENSIREFLKPDSEPTPTKKDKKKLKKGPTLNMPDINFEL